jgi:hypothetical protein
MGLNQSAVGVDKNTLLLIFINWSCGKTWIRAFFLWLDNNAMADEVGGMANLLAVHKFSQSDTQTRSSWFWGVDEISENLG